MNKLILCLGLLTLMITTIWICSTQPIMHKPLAINTIEYLIKFNNDGSITTTKQITQTSFKEVQK